MALKTNNEIDEIVSDINMTPFIDIMLVLLILFMVTSSISLESGLDIDLPKSNGKLVSQSSDAVIVSLKSDGNIFLQGNSVQLTEFKEKLQRILESSKNKLVVFEGDKKSSLGKTIKILDLATEAGASNFAIATEN